MREILFLFLQGNNNHTVLGLLAILLDSGFILQDIYVVDSFRINVFYLLRLNGLAINNNQGMLVCILCIISY